MKPRKIKLERQLLGHSRGGYIEGLVEIGFEELAIPTLIKHEAHLNAMARGAFF
jgi:hypothetical protein